MKKASAADRALVIEILTRSFENNQSVNYIVRQDKRLPQRIRALMEYSFEVCMLFGEVWLSADKKACALVLYPDRKKTNFRAVWLDIKLIFKAIGLSGIKKALDREAKIKTKQPKIPMAYLWFIGVTPLYQHRGTGSKLLAEIVAYEQRQDRPVFLETSTLRNLPWYERSGFQVYDRLELSYTLYFLNNLPA